MQLWNMLQKSPKKMASFLQTQLRIKNLQLTTQESKTGASKRLKKACTTRWLSFDSSVQAIDSEYEAVLQTLNILKEKDPTSLGLYQKLKCVKFIGIIYMLVEVLPLLTVVSKTFQIGTIDFSKIGPTLEYTTEKLIAVKENKSPIKRLKDDLKEGQRLSELGITATEHQIQLIENHMNSYIDELIKNIDRRFRDCLPVLSAVSVFDPLKVPGKDSPGFKSYGKSQIHVLCDHFTKNLSEDPKGRNDVTEEIVAEYGKFKYDMLNMKAEVPEECKPANGPCKVTSLQWCLQKIVEASHFYPRLSFIAEAILVVPVSNAWLERGASCVKRLKTRLRSRLQNKTLNALMAISINGEEAWSEMAKSVIADAVQSWLAAKKRRRLPKKTHQTGEEDVEQNRLANEANKDVSQTVDACVQTDRDMLKEIVKEEISAYKLHQEYTSSPDSDEGFDDESDYDYKDEF